LRTVPLSSAEKTSLGLNPEGFASRVTERRWVGRLTFVPVRVGDVIHSVNGVDECVMARTATDYVQLRHQPGETVELGLLRRGERLSVPLRLYRNALPERWRRGLWRLMNAAGRAS
jgi:hypothetical protein